MLLEIEAEEKSETANVRKWSTLSFKLKKSDFHDAVEGVKIQRRAITA